MKSSRMKWIFLIVGIILYCKKKKSSHVGKRGSGPSGPRVGRRESSEGWRNGRRGCMSRGPGSRPGSVCLGSYTS